MGCVKLQSLFSFLLPKGSLDQVSIGLEEGDTRETLQEQADSATLSEEKEKGDATVSTSVDLMDTNIT